VRVPPPGEREGVAAREREGVAVGVPLRVREARGEAGAEGVTEAVGEKEGVTEAVGEKEGVTEAVGEKEGVEERVTLAQGSATLRLPAIAASVTFTQ
jgi:hypothetical protein